MSSPTQASDSMEPTSSGQPEVSFDRPFVDVVLRSTDGVEFHTLQQLLIDASHVFSDMFSMPQPPSARRVEDEKMGTAVKTGTPTSAQGAHVDMAETGDTLRMLVHIFHPFVPIPVFASFDDFKPIMRAWVKYDLRGHAKERAHAALAPFLFAEPLRVYAFAAQLQQPELTKAAAQACLRLTDVWSPDAVELDDISGRTYRRLLVYRDACIATIRSLERLDRTDCAAIFGAGWAWITTCKVMDWTDSTERTLARRQRLGPCKPASGSGRGVTHSGPKDFLGDELMATLRATPHLAVLQQDDALDFAMRYTTESGCSTCIQTAHRQIPSYRAALIAEIGRRLAEVPF